MSATRELREREEELRQALAACRALEKRCDEADRLVREASILVEQMASEKDALRKNYVDLADAILPSSTSTHELIDEVRRLRVAAASIADHKLQSLASMRGESVITEHEMLSGYDPCAEVAETIASWLESENHNISGPITASLAAAIRRGEYLNARSSKAGAK